MGYTLNNIKNSPLKDLNYSFISSDYGPRTFYNNVTGKTINDFHDGIDMTSGKYVVAVFDGKVIESRNNVIGYNESLAFAAGNYVKIDHQNGLFSIYAHMQYGSVPVNVGDYVKKGDIIGQMGCTGFATGKHLHFGINKGGKWVDPKPFIQQENNQISNPEKVPEPSMNQVNGNYIEYIVKRGDTLSAIANVYNTTVEALASLNKISNPNLIFINQKILIPIKKGNNVYIVKAGDSLSSIAQKYGTTWQKIYEDNKSIIGSNPNLIYPNMELKL